MASSDVKPRHEPASLADRLREASWIAIGIFLVIASMIFYLADQETGRRAEAHRDGARETAVMVVDRMETLLAMPVGFASLSPLVDLFLIDKEIERQLADGNAEACVRDLLTTTRDGIAAVRTEVAARSDEFRPAFNLNPKVIDGLKQSIAALDLHCTGSGK